MPRLTMGVPIEFMKTMFVNGVGLATWITTLLTVNMLLPLVFIATPEGQLVLAAAMVGALIQMVIFASKGFVRLLGIGHVFWIPLVPWLWTRMNEFPTDDPMGLWIAAVILLDSISLIIDVADVARYLAGDQSPHLTAN